MDRSRRRFIGDAARSAGGAALFALGLGLYARQSESKPPEALRPPGALDEPDFVGACVRCGLCVRHCPYDTLLLARLEQPMAVGTPYFVARDIPCEMCEDIPCVEACPTGALDPALTDMNFLGLRCDVCYRVCPLIDEAIKLKLQHNARSGKHAMMLPTVQADACTGCGKCEYACVLPEAAIKVLPRRLARGAAGDHYRVGWEEPGIGSGIGDGP
jgi:ferredoxin-type protein NapG